jgi:hypothetical protein
VDHRDRLTDLLQPSNQLPTEPATVDVFPNSDRIIDFASLGYGAEPDGRGPVFVEIGHLWPPNKANALGRGMWRLTLLVSGDNIKAERYFVTVSFDRTRLDPESPEIWEHFLVEGPSTTRGGHPWVG